MTAAQLLTEGCALADGQIDRAGSVLDEAEFLRHLCKGELAAPDAPKKRTQNPMFVYSVGNAQIRRHAAQLKKFLKVSFDGFGSVEHGLMPGGVVQRADVLPEHLGCGTLVQPEPVDDAFLCAPPSLAVAAPGSL